MLQDIILKRSISRAAAVWFHFMLPLNTFKGTLLAL